MGKKLVETLLAEGHEVRILTRNSVTARIALPQAALGGAKFYAHDSGASGGIGLRGAFCNRSASSRVSCMNLTSHERWCRVDIAPCHPFRIFCPRPLPRDPFVRSSVIRVHAMSQRDVVMAISAHKPHIFLSP